MTNLRDHALAKPGGVLGPEDRLVRQPRTPALRSHPSAVCRLRPADPDDRRFHRWRCRRRAWIDGIEVRGVEIVFARDAHQRKQSVAAGVGQPPPCAAAR